MEGIFVQYYSLHLKPFKNIDNALRANKGKVKVNFNLNNSDSFLLIINLYVTLKILKTINEQYDNIRHRYNVRFINKLLWSENTCEIRVNNNNFAIDVYTGARLGFDNPSKVVNKNIGLDSKFYGAFNKLVALANKSFPKNELENLEQYLKKIRIEA